MARVLYLVAAAAVIGALSVTASVQSVPQEPRPAQDPPSAQQPPTFRAGVNFVRVDAVVTDKDGAPVPDLTPDDFEVIEGGKLQKIELFKLVSLDGSVSPLEGAARISSDAVEQSEAARDDVRLFAIFLDDYHVSREWGHVAREQVARFVEKQLGPSDMVGVMYPLTNLASIRMTRNHEAVVKDVLRFEGRKNDFAPKNGFEEAYVYKYPMDIPRIRREVSFSALRGLIMHLGGLKEGRQSLIVVSEGYIADNLGLRSEMDLLGSLTEFTELANRSNTAIYTVHPQVLPPGTQWLPTGPMDTLSFLAERTGGRAIFDQTRTGAEMRDRGSLLTTPDPNIGAAALPISNLATAMKQIAVDSSAYYLIGYNSTLTIPDGKYHKIDVRVKRSGVQVHHRQGYWALRLEDRANMTAIPAAAPSVVDTSRAASAIPRGRPVRTWIGMERGQQGLTRVTFSWEPAASAPAGSAARDSERPARVAIAATGSGGETYFSGRVPEVATETSRGSSVSFEVPPGTVQLRLRVEGSGSTILDTEVRDLRVADLSAPRTLLGTPQVFRAATVPELQRLKTGAQASPAAAREFRRTERLLIRVPAYGVGGTTPTLSAQLISRSGQTLTELIVDSTSAANGLPQVEVELAKLGLGDYAVRIRATDASGSAEEIVAFRVTNGGN